MLPKSLSLITSSEMILLSLVHIKINENWIQIQHNEIKNTITIIQEDKNNPWCIMNFPFSGFVLFWDRILLHSKSGPWYSSGLRLLVLGLFNSNIVSIINSSTN